MERKSKIVYTFGAWDILHSGHLNFLKKARSLGDILIVGVQSDKAIEKCKPESSAILEKQRLGLIESLKYVNKAELYDFDYLDKFKKSGANILCMSESHRNTERLQDLYKYIVENYGEESIIFLPYDASVSSSSIKKEIRNKSWGSIWENVASSEKNDWEICGYESEEDIKRMANYIRDKMGIKLYYKVLDYGCGSGLILKNLELTPGSIGVDASLAMILRAKKNNPKHIFFVNNRPLLFCDLDVAISWGVFQYLDDYEHAELVIRDMINLCNNILIMEIPDMSKKEAREKHRADLHMNPYPPHLYYSKEFFSKFGFRCYDNDIFLTKHAHFSFTTIKGDI